MKRLFATLLLTLVFPLSALAAEDGWVDLFDGKTLKGWAQHNGIAKYEAQDGTIVGKTALNSPNSFLCTEKDYGDFELEFDVKVDEGLNSGVQLRSRERTEKDSPATDPVPLAGKNAAPPSGKKEQKAATAPKEKKNKKTGAAKGGKKKTGGGPKSEITITQSPNQSVGRVFGPQVEIAAGGADGSLSGYIYGEAMGTWRTLPERVKPHSNFKNGEWNHFRVVAKGPRIQTWINGQAIEDLTDEPMYKTHPKGFLSLQVHGVGDKGPFQVAWKNIRLRELK